MTVLFGAHGLAATLTADAGRGLIERMGARARATGPASRPSLTSTVAADGVAFGVCELQYAGESTPVRTAQVGPLLLVTQGRLDTRAELMELLGLPAGTRAHAAGGLEDTPSDTDLILAAYQRFGIDCVDHLVGDWAFALWDAERQRMLLARDASGISALYWWHGDGQLLFASSLATLLAAGPVPTRPNPRWIAGVLTVFTDPAHPGATAFEGVHSLAPGHLVIAQGGRAELKRWWRPETLAPLDHAPLPELQARFLALYDDAVQRRLSRCGGSVAATLSGGLDSSSVVALAAPALAQQGQRLTAFVHIPAFDPGNAHPERLTNEWDLAQATARHVGNVDAVACTTQHISPVQGIHRWLDFAAQPSHAVVNWFWLQDLAEQAVSAGARVLLTGGRGNATVSHEGNGNLWPSLRKLRLARVRDELSHDEAGWPAALRDRLIKPALRPAWHGLKRAAAGRGSEPGWSMHGPLNPSLADELGLDAAMRAASHSPGFTTTSADRVAQFRLGLLGGADSGAAAWAELGTHCGLDVRDPTQDLRIVELCWRLPDELFWSHGRRRGLIRAGMRGLLPPQVLTNPRRGLQSADILPRLRACRDELLAEVDAVSRHDLVREWVDTPRLAQWAQAAIGEHSSPQHDVFAASHMLRALAVAVLIAHHG